MRTTFAIFCILLLGTLAHAAVTARAGKYTVAITAQPAVPASGDNLFVLTVTDGGQPLTGAAVAVHADMTSMSMPVDAVAAPGRTPGEYGATVPLAMAGAWTLDVAVHQMAGMTMDGDGTAHFLVKTGSGITAVGGGGIVIPWGWVIAGALAALVMLTGIVYRRLPMKARGSVVGVLTLLLVLAGTVAVVRKYRDKKTSTVLASAFMDMSAQAAPGTAAVAAETLHAAPFRAAALYTGTVAPDQEEDVYPRVTGRLVSMPLYPGDRVTPGQVVAQLDATELDAKEAQARLGSVGAGQQNVVAGADIAIARAGQTKSRRAVEQMRAQLTQAQAAARAAEGAAQAAQSEVTSAQQAATEADGAVLSAQAGIDGANEAVTQAQGDVESAAADVEYWTKELTREKELFAKGAIAREELERETAQEAAAQAKLKSAKAAARTAAVGVTRAKQELAQAQARRGAAGSAIITAQARVAQAQADRDAAQGRIGEVQAAVATAEADVSAADAGTMGAQAKARAVATAAEQAHAALTEAATVRGYTTIRASVGGVVTARNIAPGVLVQPGMSILKIAKIDLVRIQVNVSEADLAQVRLGQTLTARTPDGISISARVSDIFPARDTAARTATVEARVPNPGGRLKPGQYLSVTLDLGGAASVLSVPTAALTVRDGHASVFVIDDGLRAAVRRVSVTTGRLGDARTEILTGLRDGDRVVTSGLANLRDGDAVTVLTGGK